MTENLYPVEKPRDYKFHQFKLVGDDVVELKRIVAHHFEVEDHHHYRDQDAVTKMCEWLASDRGKWIMENAFEIPYYDHYKRPDTWTVEFKVVATFTTKKLTEYYLRFS